MLVDQIGGMVMRRNLKVAVAIGIMVLTILCVRTYTAESEVVEYGVEIPDADMDWAELEQIEHIYE